MKKFAVSRPNKRPFFTIEAGTIRQAIINFAEIANVGIKEKLFIEEEYASVLFHRNGKISCEIAFSLL